MLALLADSPGREKLSATQHEMAGFKLTQESLRKKLLAVKRSSSTVGAFDVASKEDDQWFRLPIVVKSAPKESLQ